MAWLAPTITMLRHVCQGVITLLASRCQRMSLQASRALALGKNGCTRRQVAHARTAQNPWQALAHDLRRHQHGRVRLRLRQAGLLQQADGVLAHAQQAHLVVYHRIQRDVGQHAVEAAGLVQERVHQAPAVLDARDQLRPQTL